MAEFGGISRASQRLYEKSVREPRLSYLYNLAAAGADLSFLMMGARDEIKHEGCVVISPDSISKSYLLVTEMLLSDTARVRTLEDANDLLMGIVTKLHEAELPEIDVDAISKASEPL